MVPRGRLGSLTGLWPCGWEHGTLQRSALRPERACRGVRPASQLGPSLCCRYNGATRDAYFSVGLQGVAQQDVQAVRDLIDRTIEDVLQCVGLRAGGWPSASLMLSAWSPPFPPSLGFLTSSDAYPFTYGCSEAPPVPHCKIIYFFLRSSSPFSRKGFEDDQIEALLHKIEIQMKHQSVSFGLALTSVCNFSPASFLSGSVCGFCFALPIVTRGCRRH